MVEEIISQEFTLQNIDETGNYFVEEKEQNELMSDKRKKVCTTLNYTAHFLILASTITGCIFDFCFCFFDWYSYRNYEFCNMIKNLCSNCKN